MRNQVIRAIQEAFQQVELPQGPALTNDHCTECVETYREFWKAPNTFMSWEEAASRTGSCVEAALLSPDAWRYYLPTLIVWCVRDTEHVDVLVDNLVNELTPPAASDLAWFGPRSIGFSVSQRRAITLFLEWYRDREKAEWSSMGSDPPDDAAAAIRFWGGAG